MAQIQTPEMSISQPEPTRPTWRMAFGLVALVAVAQVASHWQDIAAYFSFA